MIDLCRHCFRRIDMLLDKDNALRWTHTGTGEATCFSTFAEPAIRVGAK